MSYNIDTVHYIGEGRLTLSKNNLIAAKLAVPTDSRPEICLFDGGLDDAGIICMPWWCAEGSGNSYAEFLEVLAYTRGSADLIMCWEGGDDYTGLRVMNGKVTEHRVVMALGEAKR